MAINTQKFLPSSKGGALTKVAKISKGSVAIISEKSQKNIGIIKVKVIEIDKLLKGTIASQKKELNAKRIKSEEEKFSELESKLETKPKAEKGKIEMPKVPKMGFLDWIKNFIGNIILGYFAVRLVDQLPKLKGVISFIGKASDFVLDIGGKLLDGLVTFIDWGYKAYDATRGFVKNLFGQNEVKQFDRLSSLLNQFLNLAIIAGMVAAGSGGGRGGRGGGGARLRPGMGGRPRVTTSGGGRASGIDIRNPLRERPRVTTSRGGRAGGIDIRNPLRERPKITSGIGSGIAEGEAKLAFKSLRPFLKRIPVPVIGSLIDFGLSWALGEDPGRAAFRAIGAGILAEIGGGLAGALGLVGGPLAFATGALGAIAGGALGDMAGGALYDLFFGGKKAPSKSKTQKRAGGGITRGGTTSKGTKRRTLNTKKGKYKRKLAPKKPGQVQIQPGADVGGEDKLFGLFPNPLKAAQNAIDMMNPFKVIENTGKELGKSDYFGPILAITSKILLGQKPNQKDYENVGLGINLLVSKGLNEGQLKGGLAAAFAEGGLVDPKTLDAINQGGDITNWVAKAFRESTENNTQDILRDIQENLRLKGPEPEKPSGGGTGPGAGGGFSGDVEYGPLPLNMTQKQAFATIYELAKKNGDPMPELTAAQAMLESGYLTSDRARLDNNPFGQTGSGTAGQVGRFARYNSLEDAVKDHIKQWQNNYKGYRGMGTYDSPMAGLKANINSYAPKSENNQTEYLKSVASILTTMGFDPNTKNPKVNLSSAALIQQRKAGSAGTISGSSDVDKMNIKKGPYDYNTYGYAPSNGQAQYITGDTSQRNNYRPDHGGGNYHDHLGFRDHATALKAFDFFKSKGFYVWEMKGRTSLGPSHQHDGWHSGGLAFDIPAAQNNWPVGRENIGSAKVRDTLKQFLGGSSNPAIAKAYAKGGETLAGPHLAMLGEKGREIVVDADSSGPARDMLLAINQAKDHKGVMKAIQQYAPYDALSPQTIVMPSSGGESDYDSGMSGGAVMMMDGGGGDSYDPFDALEMGG